MAPRARLRLLTGALAATVIALAGGAVDAPARGTAAPANNAQPTITGVAVEGQTITGHNGSWFCDPACVPSGPENRGGYEFQWQRCNAAGANCADFAGAASQSYVVAAADRGSTLRVRVTATNYDCNAHGVECRYSSTSAFSAVTAVVPGVPPAPPPPPPPPGPPEGSPVSHAPPVVGGVAQEGETLTASTGDWSGVAPIGFSYQWSRCGSVSCTAIVGETGTTYAVRASDVGSRLRVAVRATNVLGTSTATSLPSSVVTAVADLPPISMAPPTVFGTPRHGSTLTAVPGSWRGSPPPTFTFAWLRCEPASGVCLPIAGADGANYVVRTEDGGRQLAAVVTAANAAGTATATSPPTAVVAPAGLLRLLDGRESIPATSVAPPDRLRVQRVRVRFVRPGTVVATVHVSDTRGYLVRGALVSVRPARAGDGTASRPVASSVGGDAVLRFAVSQRRLARGGTLVLVVRAVARGDAAPSASARVRVALRPVR